MFRLLQSTAPLFSTADLLSHPTPPRRASSKRRPVPIDAPLWNLQY
ncbi:MAG: hypothetical protein ACK53Y_05565 [bacterium]